MNGPLPCRVNKPLVAVLFLKSLKANLFFHSDDSLTLQFMRHASLTLTRVHAVSQLEKARNTLESLAKVGDEPSIRQRLLALSELTTNLLGCDSVTCHAYDAENDRIAFEPVYFGSFKGGEIKQHNKPTALFPQTPKRLQNDYSRGSGRTPGPRAVVFSNIRK